MLRYLTAGESHGQALLTIVEGMPAGLWLTADYIDRQLERRQGGFGRGPRQRLERDRVEIISGIRGGFTLGSPIGMRIANRDWENWREVMNPGLEASLDERVITRPRPGHADLAGALKYAFYDLRNVLERASARETVARVAAGTVARRLLEELGIGLAGQVIQIGEIKATPAEGTPEEIRSQADASPVYCPDPGASTDMVEAIQRAEQAGDTLGGVFEIRVYGVPPGLGSYVHWDRRLDGNLARALMSIPGIKGVEVGGGFGLAALPGSKAHDEIFYSPVQGYYRVTNRAGGLEGGVTNGEPLVVRAAMKPIPTLRKPLRSVDMFTKEAVTAAYERADICAVPSACVIGEAVVAWEIASACLEKFGGDTMAEIKESFLRYKTRIRRGER
ncbi:chorismate synthase [Desulfothermobacter acidiphilus]|uniref:chorismate synthase n=1 Tax=Desulfothermobacter acidiphilus TaxID=1938353 RepID=UPI003F88726C